MQGPCFRQRLRAAREHCASAAHLGNAPVLRHNALYSSEYNDESRNSWIVESGICRINGPTVQDEAQTPFGGMKASGYGRFNALAAINEFTELRWITVETEPHHYPF
jgi:acyl-CoA reductase-like NAD-dependent aldehyde dehydrogenase